MKGRSAGGSLLFDVYWKIGLSLADVDTARSKLLRQDVEVTSPRQFRDIGYMCHLCDLFGFFIRAASAS